MESVIPHTYIKRKIVDSEEKSPFIFQVFLDSIVYQFRKLKFQILRKRYKSKHMLRKTNILETYSQELTNDYSPLIIPLPNKTVHFDRKE